MDRLCKPLFQKSMNPCIFRAYYIGIIFRRLDFGGTSDGKVENG
jgi:hypothetical protein